jgi:choice-of-anchor B domain-containing protein
MKYAALLSLCIGLLVMTAPSVAADACSNGNAGGYECSHVERVAHLSAAELGGSGEKLNDIWGWTDPNGGAEYVIIGMFDGTAFVRLAADGTPTFLGRLRATDGESAVPKTGNPHGPNSEKLCHDECDAEASSWRDIKVNGNHAYIVSEASGHGMQVFDLTRLRGVTAPPSNDYIEDLRYDNIGHAHNIVINEDRDRAYIVGAGSRAQNEGGLHILDISSPPNVGFLGEVNQDGYTHDAQCVNYAGPAPSLAGEDICFAANEDMLTIWNVSDPGNPEMLSRSSYGANDYTHQVWLSADQRYAFLNDELDESNRGTRTNTRVFDVSDPRNPELVAEYLAPTYAIDHNNYVKGRFLYQANYLAGLRILDVFDPEHPVEAAYFDVSSSDAASFSGAWSVYPFFDSEYLVVSDIQQGLFVLRSTLDGTSNQADVTVDFDTTSIDVPEDETVTVTVTVTNAGGIDLDDVLLTVYLPGGTDLEAGTLPDNWSCVSGGSDTQRCRINVLAAGATAGIAFDVSANQDGSGDAYAMVYARQVDATPADNRTSVPITFAGSALDNTGGGGSSGGGAPGLPVLTLLLVLVATRRR